MTIEATDDTHRRFLEHKRTMMMNRLLHVIDTIEQRGQKVEAVVEAAVPGGDPATPDAQREVRRIAIGAVGGALAGAALMGVTAWALHRATRPRSLVEHATRALAGALVPRPSPIVALLQSAAGSLATAAVSRLAQQALTHWLRDSSAR